jgi:ABC-2 type transport system ATP-binding protein
MASNAIEVNGLGKSYGGLKAVDNVSLAVEAGSIFGLLGPNGAGKTTLISMLVTMRRPSGGSAKVNGFDVVEHPGRVRQSIGIVFQDQSLDEDLTARENLEMHAAMYNVPKKERRERIEGMVRLVGLEKNLNTVVKTFSGGMRRRLEIARGLVHHPKVLFLDEPTIGLDPQTRAGIWDYIRKLNREKGITIILTTHYMDEADGVCSKIAIIDHGKIIAGGTPKELKDGLGGDIISLECKGQEQCAKALGELKWVKSATKHDGLIDIRVENGEQKIPKILSLMAAKGIAVDSVNLRKPSLDDVFMHYTGRTIREEEAKPGDAMRLMRKAGGHR